MRPLPAPEVEDASWHIARLRGTLLLLETWKFIWRVLIRLVQAQEAGCPGHAFSADLEGLVVACHEQPT